MTRAAVVAVVAIAAWPAATGSIAYKCGDSLCLSRADGSGKRALLAAGRPWPQWDPAFSPDGRMIAFRGYYGIGDGAYALYVVRTDGCAVRRLTRSIASDPSWSPDGKWIAFDTSGEGEILKVHPDGTALTRIVGASGADYDSSPAWSPGGKRIAFIHYRRGRGQLWIVNADGRGARELHADVRSSDELPVWSHDGKRIAFAALSQPRSWIEVINADGAHARRLTETSGRAWNPMWMPGDAGIAFLSVRMIVAMRPDGTDVHRLTLPSTEQFTWIDASLPPRRC